MQNGNNAILGADSPADGRIDRCGMLCMACVVKGLVWSMPSRIAVLHVLRRGVRSGGCAAFLSGILGAMISLWGAATEAQTPMANAQLSATGSDAYSITLTNAGTTTIGTFWYAWLPAEDFIALTPTNVTSPAGWNATITGGGSGDGYAIEWLAASPANYLAAGNSLSSFSFDSTLPAVQLTSADSPFFPGTPVGTSVAYT